jgi:D-serine deaminase-like pyridoxal phosphate-dependent protein
VPSGGGALSGSDLVPDVVVDATTKGFPQVATSVPLGAVHEIGWRLADLQPPVMALRESALTHNVELMAAYCRRRGVDLAPHGKTTMAPQLWARQLDAGAWGMSAATAQQARVLRAAGVRRILVANTVVDGGSIAWVAEQLADPSIELLCYVDSNEGLDVLEERIPEGLPRLRVLVELGHADGRTGCRTVDDALGLARRVHGSSSLALAGASGFEGTVCRDRTPACLDRITSYLDNLRVLADALLHEELVDGPEEMIVSAGGSAFFDLVVDRLRAGDLGARVVLRSGCYLTHDSGLYERLSPFAGELPGGRFRSAIEVWASVLSRPEPDLAILGMGRRDVPFDQGPPVPHTVRPAGVDRVDATEALSIEALNDQHAICRVPAGFSLGVGDLVGCGISHPCTAFDKWRVIPVLDDDDHVIDAVATFF